MNDSTNISKIITTGSVITILFLITMQFVSARPLQNPPTGDPVLDLAGPQGAQGPQGPQGSTGATGPGGTQGPQGPKGDSICNIKTASCYSAAFNGCTISVSTDYGYQMTGGDCMTSNTMNIWVLDSSPYSDTQNCYCHDYMVATNAYCYAVLWQCRRL